MKLDKKTLATALTFLFIGIIVTSIIWVYATPTTTFYISGGVYPQGDYTIFSEGSNYFAKNIFGQIPSWGENTNVTALWENVRDDGLTSGRDYKEKVVFVGDFTVSATLYVEAFTIIELQGKFTLANNVSVPILRNKNWYTDNLGGIPTDHAIEIVGGVWDCNGANQEVYDHTGISFRGHYDVTVRNTHVQNAYGYAGIYLGEFNQSIPCGSTIEGNTVNGVIGSGTWGAGIAVTGGAGGVALVRFQTVIANNHVFNARTGILVEDGVHDVIITGNTIHNSSQGGIIGAVVWDIIVSNNIVYNTTGYRGISMDIGYGITISDNRVYLSEWAGIYILKINNATITGNSVIDSDRGAGVPIYGIYVSGEVATNITGIIITSNWVDDITTDEIDGGIFVQYADYVTCGFNYSPQGVTIPASVNNIEEHNLDS